MPVGAALIRLTLLWLAGFGLRLTVLAVPPIIPLLRADLHLSQTIVGFVSGLPVAVFAAVSIPASLLIARYGASATLIGGLLLGALGGALRAGALGAVSFCAATALMAAGIAVIQPALPPLVRQWLPARVGFATALYTNGLLIGELVPVALTLPIILPALNGSWRFDLIVWSVPLALVALLFALTRPALSAGPAMPIEAAQRWWPDWRDGRLWRLGLMFGAVTSTYFGTNAFLPEHLVSLGRPDLITGALSALNFAQIPASFLILTFGRHLERKHWPLVGLGLLGATGVTGIMFGPTEWMLACTALIGFACAGILSLALALPPLLSAPDDVHLMSAGMFAIGYSCALVFPVIAGALWDLTGTSRAAFVPILLCAMLIASMAATLNFGSRAWGVAERP